MNHILGRLLQDDESINIARVKLQPALPVKDELGEELEHAQDDFIIIMKSIKCRIDYPTEILGIEPVEEEFKCATRD